MFLLRLMEYLAVNSNLFRLIWLSTSCQRNVDIKVKLEHWLLVYTFKISYFSHWAEKLIAPLITMIHKKTARFRRDEVWEYQLALLRIIILRKENLHNKLGFVLVLNTLWVQKIKFWTLSNSGLCVQNQQRKKEGSGGWGEKTLHSLQWHCSIDCNSIAIAENWSIWKQWGRWSASSVGSMEAF